MEFAVGGAFDETINYIPLLVATAGEGEWKRQMVMVVVFERICLFGIFISKEEEVVGG